MPYSFREDSSDLEPQPAGQRAGKPPDKSIGTDLLDEPPGGSTEVPPGTMTHWIAWLVLTALAILAVVALFGLFT